MKDESDPSIPSTKSRWAGTGAGESTSLLARRCFRAAESARAVSSISVGGGRSDPLTVRYTRAAVHEGVGDRCGLIRRIAEDVNRAP